MFPRQLHGPASDLATVRRLRAILAATPRFVNGAELRAAGCTKRRPPRQRLLPSELRGKDDRLELAELRLIDSRLTDVALNVCNGDE